MRDNFLDTPIEYLKGVGPVKGELLKQDLGIYCFADLLIHYPFRYIDRTKFYKINEITSDLPYIQCKGILIRSAIFGVKRSQRLVAYFKDETGILEIVWFAGIRWIKDTLKPFKEYIIFGKPSSFNGKINIAHPELELVSEQKNSQTTFLQPIYNTTEKLKSRGLASKGIMMLVKNLIAKSTGNISENLPDSILNKYKLLNRTEAIINIHFPGNAELLQNAQRRLKFEELFIIQLNILSHKNERRNKFIGFNFPLLDNCFNKFYKEHLPFELTNAQKKVIKEIRKDVTSAKQMNRLLQGDVGSGKTVVAVMIMLMAIDNNYQSCLMVPTEILAKQHFQSISNMLNVLGVNISLLTGSTKKKERRIILERLINEDIHLLIGTHSLIEETVEFKNLGLVVIDEQHRFGVEQRARLWSKNTNPPHILVMTATPIPRTLAMTIYGDLEISVIDELPSGRKPIKTLHGTDANRLRVFGFLKEQIKNGKQIFVVYPLIKESEKLDYKDLMDGYESICRAFPKPEYHISIIHGKMKSKDKDFEMQQFIKGQTQIMVATNVIEVGINIPTATVMVIESSERFGLSQLHQLRGRVGRGADQSYCILMTSDKLSNDSQERVQAMVSTNDGFEIAEMDLKLRGPGNLEGTQQSGAITLHIADLVKDVTIIQEARLTANEILNNDPLLSSPQNQPLKNFLKYTKDQQFNWGRIS